MKTNVFIFAILVVSFQSANAFTFKSLTKNIPVIIKNEIPDNIKKSDYLIESCIILKINKNPLDSNVYFKIEYSLDGEKLTDYYNVQKPFDDTIKKFVIRKDQQLELKIFLNDKYNEKKEVDGTIFFHNKKFVNPELGYNQHVFTGNYWYFKDSPLLKFSKDNNKKYNLKIRFFFNENFIYDKLLLNFKTITPQEGIIEWEDEVLVNDDEYLSFHPKTIELFLGKINVEKQGFYYIQCRQIMTDIYLNGIIKIDYELLEVKNNN